MEVSHLIRSGSFHTRSGSFQFCRSTSIGKMVSLWPRMVHVARRGSKEFRRPRLVACLNGMGNGGIFNGGSNGGQGGSDESENQRIHDHYKQMLRSDPENPLLLRNYGKFLYEEGDWKGAEECYERAILANPGDGELLMLYGKLVWENYRDKERAGAYLQRATMVSPHDWGVLAAYLRFYWVVEDDENEDKKSEN